MRYPSTRLAAVSSLMFLVLWLGSSPPQAPASPPPPAPPPRGGVRRPGPVGPRGPPVRRPHPTDPALGGDRGPSHGASPRARPRGPPCDPDDGGRDPLPPRGLRGLPPGRPPRGPRKGHRPLVLFPPPVHPRLHQSHGVRRGAPSPPAVPRRGPEPRGRPGPPRPRAPLPRGGRPPDAPPPLVRGPPAAPLRPRRVHGGPRGPPVLRPRRGPVVDEREASAHGLVPCPRGPLALPRGRPRGGLRRGSGRHARMGPRPRVGEPPRVRGLQHPRGPRGGSPSLPHPPPPP